MKICCVWDHVTSWQHFQVEYVGITADTSEADVVLWTCAVPLVVLCLYCVPSSKHVFFFPPKRMAIPERDSYMYIVCNYIILCIYIIFMSYTNSLIHHIHDGGITRHYSS